MRKPHVGQIVMCPMAAHENNGVLEAPAVVTRVCQTFDEYSVVNVAVLPDAGSYIIPKMSVYLYQLEDDARSYNGTACWLLPVDGHKAQI